ncbi:hypothetical protein [Streptomyces sp. VRA16 Mangrove soil]|uniref:hypothetical protein n=1 Tax=Streptomyces sp. VRA16 Mangrove soil TaxID=2817434 RepID=UPI001A9D32BE|nr:hypothetical protein [Streptomyces sp. VRA16 Mangrove soil]MBO1330654.1 hypothetical protein [Streptomyces sp. VRA16 Mangrove soil]
MSGGAVYRIDWLPGTDLLSGRCHCGARHEDQDPVAMWEWMLAHPDHPSSRPSSPLPSTDKDRHP